MSSTPEEKAREFLNHKHLYMLGDLTTERPHALTTNLSGDAVKNLPGILKIIQQIEINLIASLEGHLSEIEELQFEIEQTLNSGGRIFICGCGATGRLALTLEYLWRALAPVDLRDRVIGFMAGGDVALVRSLERIEDEPETGAQHLRSLGFRENDLLISCTEGGETPYVIGSTEEAQWISKRRPYFLFCNSSQLLCQKVERSRKVIENNNIKSISLSIDPMVLAGSTRLQATTALLLTVGAALFPKVTSDSPRTYLSEYKNDIAKLDFTKLSRFIELESEAYDANQRTLYQTEEYGITILTDTTERSPTFSLSPFENSQEPTETPSLCYLHLVHTRSSHEAWQKLLHRPPRPEGRPDWIIEKGEDWVFGYDFSEIGKSEKLNRILFNIWDEGKDLHFEFRGHHSHFELQTDKLFLKHLILKVLLNSHSTLVMGRLHRYHKNIMTFVKPSCGKLVDRAIRNIQFVLNNEPGNKKAPSYEELALAIFSAMQNLSSSEAIVMKVVNKLKATGSR